MPAVDDLERGRASCAQGAWRDAYEALSSAVRSARLEAQDLVLLATAAYMLGREPEYVSILERAHHLHLEAGEPLPAARIAFWVGMQLMLHGEMGRATGWLGRAQRLVEREPGECVEQGYMLLPLAFRHEAMGDLELAAATAADAAAIGERFGDSDLFALAAHAQGMLLVSAGRVEAGLALLDEAMVAVTADELSPIVRDSSTAA